MKELLGLDLILFGVNEATIPNRKYLLKENLTESVPSLYYMGGSDDALLEAMGLKFENPKPIKSANYFLSIMARPKDSLVMDYFAGSGTTAHALINMNRAEKEQGRRDGDHRQRRHERSARQAGPVCRGAAAPHGARAGERQHRRRPVGAQRAGLRLHLLRIRARLPL